MITTAFEATVSRVVAELLLGTRMVANRRLQLAVMTSSTPALLARRWPRQGVCPLTELSIAKTGWRIAYAIGPTAPPGVRQVRWTERAGAIRRPFS